MLISDKGAAVITPYYKEDLALLERCRKSVLAQGYPITHFFVADGFPKPELADWDCEHIILSRNHDDSGDTPRGFGAISAMNLGYWPILFLDADNTYEPNHLHSILECKEKNPDADVICTWRNNFLPDGTHVPHDFAEDLEKTGCDTSCYAFYPGGFRGLGVWAMMPNAYCRVDDKVVYWCLQQWEINIVWTDLRTMNYTTNHSSAYRVMGREVPDNHRDYHAPNLVENANMVEFHQRIGLPLHLGLAPA